MYDLLLISHAWLGWVAIATAIGALVTATMPTVNHLLPPRWFARGLRISLASQIIAGVLLYFSFSPFTAGVRANVEVVLHDPTLRYWNVLHPIIGLLALAVVVYCPLDARRTQDADAAHARKVWLLLLALALMVAAAVPWPA